MTNCQSDTDFSRLKNVDPPALLLSELEILVAKTRLLEVYLEQAQASAELGTHRVTESYRAELAALRAELNERNNTLEQYRSNLREADGRLQRQLQAFQTQLQEQQAALECREQELQTNRSELAALRASRLQLEISKREEEAAAGAAERRAAELQAALAEMRTELADTALELEQRTSRARELEERLSVELQHLKAQLAEKEAQAAAQDSALVTAQDELNRLRQHASELEAERNHAIEQAASESQRTQAALEGQLAAWRDTVEQKNRSLAERESELAEIQRQSQTQITRLQAELADKQHRAETLEKELGAALVRAADLEAQTARADIAIQESAAAAQEFARIRQQLESDLAVLRSDLAAKEQTLADGRAAAATLEESLQRRNRELQAELEQTRVLLDAKERDAEKIFAEVALLRDHVTELEGIAAAGRSALAAAEAARQAAETDRAALHATVADTGHTLAQKDETFSRRESELIGELAELRARLSATETAMDGGAVELRQARAEIAALNDEKSGLELLQRQTERLLSAQAEQIRRQVRAEIADLENRVSEKEQMLQTAEQQSAQAQQCFNAKISALQLDLAEKQLRVQSEQAEIDSLKFHASILSEQLGEMASAKRRFEAVAEAASSARAEHEAELSALRKELSQARLKLEEQDVTATMVEQDRAAQFLELQDQLTLARQERDLLVKNNRRETAALQERLAELEVCSRREKGIAAADAEEMRKRFQGELAMLQCEIQQKDWAIAQRQVALENLAHHHKEQIQKLETKLAEAQRFAENRGGDFEKAQTEAASLRERIAQLETAVEHAQISAAYQLTQVQREHEEQLTALQAELAQRSRELEARARCMEEGDSAAKIELQHLSIEVEEKRALLNNRNEELLLVKAEMDLLQERVLQLDEEAERQEQAAASEREQMRNDFQAQIALLQAEVSQKQWALDERQATVYGVEHALGAQIQDLQAELAQKEDLLKTHSVDFSIEPAELTEAQNGRLHKIHDIVSAAINADASFPASRNGRWQSRFGWKRRWRS